MAKNVAFFYPHNPVPPLSGADHYALSLLRALIHIGAKVHFLSSDLWSTREWTQAAQDELKRTGVQDVHLYKAAPGEARRVRRPGLRMRIAMRSRWVRRFYRPKPEIFSRRRDLSQMRKWVSHTLTATDSSALCMNYSVYDGIVDHHANRDLQRILIMHDLCSRNAEMQDRLRCRMDIPVRDLKDVPARVTELDFFANPPIAPWRRELRAIARYTDAIAISATEQESVQAARGRVRVWLGRPVAPVIHVENSCTGNAFFPSSPNPFNVHAYILFAKCVMPSIRESSPDFQLMTSGTGADLVPDVPGIVKLGFVPDLSAVYGKSGFMVCPVLGGTGEQLKIVEAMAHGLPVVAWAQRALDSPIRDGETGFLVQTVNDFARRVVELHHDRALCRRMGVLARERVLKDRDGSINRDILARVLVAQ